MIPFSKSTRAAFYYPWFTGDWSQQGIQPYTRYYPSMGLYDSARVEPVTAHVFEMLWARINVGIASWWGPGTLTDQNLPNLLRAAQGTPFRWCIYYEAEGDSNPTVGVIKSDLAYLRTMVTRQAWLYRDNKPVVFVYGGDEGPEMAARWAAAAPDWYVVLKVFPGYEAVTPQPDSWHQYAPAVGYIEQAPYSASVSPGFWKVTEPTARLVRDPARFSADVAKMHAAAVEWHLITTWNEHGEGTGIEPCEEWGLTYLKALREAT